jgi:hypothetical protein
MTHLINDGFYLPLTVTTAYHKVISKTTRLAGIKQDDVHSLLITGSLNYLMRYLYRFQSLDLRLSGNLDEILYHSAV